MTRLFVSEEEFLATIRVPQEGITDVFFDSDVTGINENVLISTSCIKKRISGLADEIVAKNDFVKSGKELDILIVLSGSLLFASDLSRELYERHKVNVRTHFIKLSYYGNSVKSSKQNREIKVEMTPADMDVESLVIVEDIIDQGFTLQWMLEYLELVRSVKNIQICTLLNKELNNPSKEVKEIRSKIKIDYSGFVIPDIWVAGYGMDVEQKYRNVPFIFKAD